MEQHQLINGKIFGADGTLLMAEWTRYPLGTELANLARDAQLLTLTCLASDALYQSKLTYGQVQDNRPNEQNGSAVSISESDWIEIVFYATCSHASHPKYTLSCEITQDASQFFLSITYMLNMNRITLGRLPLQTRIESTQNQYGKQKRLVYQKLLVRRGDALFNALASIETQGIPQLKQERDDALAKLKQVETAQRQMEEHLVNKFVALLNAKKIKIRELQSGETRTLVGEFEQVETSNDGGHDSAADKGKRKKRAKTSETEDEA